MRWWLKRNWGCWWKSCLLSIWGALGAPALCWPLQCRCWWPWQERLWKENPRVKGEKKVRNKWVTTNKVWLLCSLKTKYNIRQMLSQAYLTCCNRHSVTDITVSFSGRLRKFDLTPSQSTHCSHTCHLADAQCVWERKDNQTDYQKHLFQCSSIMHPVCLQMGPPKQ